MQDSSNPYECPRTAGEPVVASQPYAQQALAAAVGILAIAAVAREYPDVAASAPGLMAGGLIGVVAASVGRVLAAEPVPRTLALIAAGLFVIALSLGWIRHVGGERTLWAFACMCGGLLAGTLWPSSPRGDQMDDDASSGNGELIERRN